MMTQTIRLNTGAQMPVVGFGTYLIKDPAVCERAVSQALENGYRLIDTAQFYGNEEAVGRAIRASGIPGRSCSSPPNSGTQTPGA